MKTKPYFERYVYYQVKNRYGEDLKMKPKYLKQILERNSKRPQEDRLQHLRDLFVRYTKTTYVFEIEELIKNADEKWQQALKLFEEDKLLLKLMSRLLIIRKTANSVSNKHKRKEEPKKEKKGSQANRSKRRDN